MPLGQKISATLAVLGLLVAFQLEAPHYVAWLLAVLSVVLILMPFTRSAPPGNRWRQLGDFTLMLMITVSALCYLSACIGAKLRAARHYACVYIC